MANMLFLWQTGLSDGGPVYTETDLDQVVVEPWNAVSAFLFLLVVVYWAYKLKGQYRQHPFLAYVLPVLAIGGSGGTIYHAFRYSELFLLMDWVPILILCLSAGFYFLMKSLDSWKPAVLITMGAFLLERMLFEIFTPRIATNVSYIVLASFVLLPTWRMLHKNHYSRGKYVGYALLAFMWAIFFRIADRWEWLPMGTHFLWHTFGALACYMMIHYVYAINARNGAKVKSFVSKEDMVEEELKAS